MPPSVTVKTCCGVLTFWSVVRRFPKVLCRLSWHIVGRYQQDFSYVSYVPCLPLTKPIMTNRVGMKPNGKCSVSTVQIVHFAALQMQNVSTQSIYPVTIRPPPVPHSTFNFGAFWTLLPANAGTTDPCNQTLRVEKTMRPQTICGNFYNG